MIHLVESGINKKFSFIQLKRTFNYRDVLVFISSLHHKKTYMLALIMARHDKLDTSKQNSMEKSGCSIKNS